MTHIGGVSRWIDLHAGCDEYIILDIDPIVIHHRTVHISDHSVTDVDIFPILAVEVDIHIHFIADTTEYVTQYPQSTFIVCIV